MVELSATRVLTLQRWLILLVIGWLAGVYVYDAIRVNYAWLAGAGVALLTGGIHFFFRRRAMQRVELDLQARFWMLVPTLICVVVPLGYRLVQYWWSEPSPDQPSWWWLMLEPLLRLGGPILILLWVFGALGRLRRREADAPVPVADMKPQEA